MTQLRIPAVYMRGGTSKRRFLASDLPADPAQRDRLLLRVIGSPDPYGKHIDAGMGGATSSTSKVVFVARSTRPRLRRRLPVRRAFGRQSDDRLERQLRQPGAPRSARLPSLRWGWSRRPRRAGPPFASGRPTSARSSPGHVPMRDGEVQEEGDFELDGVTFPAAEIKLEFIDPGADDGDGDGGSMFPTGHPTDWLDVAGVESQAEATLINAGLPTIFVEAQSLGLMGTELQSEVNCDPHLLGTRRAAARRWRCGHGIGGDARLAYAEDRLRRA